jgi:UDP-N-acetylmuramate--alanine ligase
MDHNKYHNIFFLGAGGIGMSALARYFYASGKNVAGYDRTATALTSQLAEEGIPISFKDDPTLLVKDFADASKTLVVYTPAVKEDNQLLRFFTDNRFTIFKRSEILGLLSSQLPTIAVAGTHGKTTVSTMIAHLLYQSSIGCLAILGGISKNYNSNYLHSENPKYFVTEADEFDRSFLKLEPSVAVVTSADADHLDIYGSEKELKHSFEEFTRNLKEDGTLILKEGTGLNISINTKAKEFSYALISGDYYAEHIRHFPGYTVFNMQTPSGKIEDLALGIPGRINVENAVAAVAASLNVGVTKEEIRQGLKTFKGIKRRFEVQFASEQMVYIDDYAHHPVEIKALVNSVRSMFPGKKITGIFQPHLFSRTKDFSTGFAESLDLMDEVFLLDIYPAREKPVEGVSSALILDQMLLENKSLCRKDMVLNEFEEKEFEILLTIGAGDIDQLVQPIKQMLIETSKTI